MIFLSLLLLSLIGLIKSEEKMSYYMEKINEMQKIIEPISKKCPREYLINELEEEENSKKIPVEFDPKKNLCRTIENLNKHFANSKKEINQLLEIFNEIRNINIYSRKLKNVIDYVDNAKNEMEKLQKTFIEIRNEILSNDLGELIIHYAKFFNEIHMNAIYEFVKKIWNYGTEKFVKDENKREYARRQNLNEYFLQLFSELKKWPYAGADLQKKVLIFKILVTGNRMGISAFNDNPMEKLEWALQQFAVNLFVYRMEMPKEMFPEGDIKFTIGMKP